LRKLLAAAPRAFGELAATVFPLAPRQEAEAGLGALVALGARVRDAAGTPVLSARYHLFARATEGAFTCLAPEGPHVALARHEICPDCRGAVFEFGSCKRCGAVYLAGTVERDANGERTELRKLVDEFGAGMAEKQVADPDGLLADALGLLSDVGLVARTEGGVLVLPLLARYRGVTAQIKEPARP